jgi:hypothetical protein
MAFHTIVYFPYDLGRKKFAIICGEEDKEWLTESCFRRWHHLKEASAIKCAKDHVRDMHGGGILWLCGAGPNGEWVKREVAGCD